MVLTLFWYFIYFIMYLLVEHQWMITEPFPALQQLLKTYSSTSSSSSSSLSSSSSSDPINHDKTVTNTTCSNVSSRVSRLSSGFYQSLSTSLPALFDADANVYLHQFDSRIGMGSYDHRGLLVDSEELKRHSHTELPFTQSHFQRAQRNLELLIPSLAPLRIAKAFNGLMTFTVDGFPIVGPSCEIQGLWMAVGVWVMHSVGLGEALAEWILAGSPPSWFDWQRMSPHRKFETPLDSKSPETRAAIQRSYEQRCAIPVQSDELNAKL